MSTIEESILPILQRFYSLEAIAKEPWDENSTLFVPINRLLLIDSAGAGSLASAIFLNMVNLQHKVTAVKNVNEMSASGVGPLLKCDRYSIGEFEPIVNFCNLKGYRLLSDYLDNSKKTLIKSYVLLIQNTFAQTITYILWKDASNLKFVKQIFRENYPWPLGDVLFTSQYYNTKNRLSAKNAWNSTKSQILESFSEIIEALNRRLEGNTYIFENRLTEADILLYSSIKFVHIHPCLQSLAELLKNFSNLRTFYTHLDDKFARILKDQLNIEQILSK